MSDLVSIKELNREQIKEFLDLAKEMKKNPPGRILQGRIMASCFFEPSTRTRLSFDAAMMRLGGSVIGFSDDQMTAVKKGESLYDSMKVIGHYSDLIVLRHPLEGSARLAAEATNKPVINAGDGANEHPTQTLLDLFTIQECQGKIDDLHIAFVGDLLHGRTVHSLAYALKQFNVRLYFVAPPSLSMPEDVCNELKKAGIRYSFHHSIEEVVDKCDILYMTRVQKERFTHVDAYLSVKDHFVLKAKMLEGAKKGLKVLHPLPRVNEIATDVDATDYAYYFQQAENGLYMRQAILCKVLERA